MTTPDFAREIKAAIDGKTKPSGALGRVEALAAQIASLQGTLAPSMERCCLTIFVGDHGIAATGVSAYPQDVTRQMVANFLSGGAAANVFARQVNADLRVVDAGIAGPPLDHPGLISARIGAGTASSLDGPAMTPHQADAAFEKGAALAAQTGCDAAAFGEMGIGNTSSAALVIAKVLGTPIANWVGRGAGLDDQQLKQKHEILARAAARTPQTLAPMDALSHYGGFEIAMMVGAITSAAKQKQLVLVDGFIASAAALVALRLEPAIRPAMVFCHVSAEAGHAALLDALGARPLLDLDMRLGEGTGTLLAWPIVKAAAAMLRDMASFESAGISGRVEI